MCSFLEWKDSKIVYKRWVRWFSWKKEWEKKTLSIQYGGACQLTVFGMLFWVDQWTLFPRLAFSLSLFFVSELDMPVCIFVVQLNKTITNCWHWKLFIAMWSCWINISAVWVWWRKSISYRFMCTTLRRYAFGGFNSYFIVNFLFCLFLFLCMCVCVGLRAGYHIQFWKGVFHLGWAVNRRRNARDIEKECAKSDRCTRRSSRGQYTRWYVWLINLPKNNTRENEHWKKKKLNLSHQLNS